jgi:hypothetical protein
VKHPSRDDLTSLQRRSGYSLSFASAIRRVVRNPECEPVSWLFCAAPSYFSSTKSSLKTNRWPGPFESG